MRNREKVGSFNLTKNIEINQRVEFEIQTGRFEGQYPTQVVDIIDNNKFVINAPFSKGKVLRVSTNTRAQVIIRGETALYSLPVKIVDKDFDATHLLVVELAGKVNKIQERRYFRLDIYKSIDCKIIIEESDLDKFDNVAAEDFFNKEDLNLDIGEGKEISVIVDDISAGGVKLITKKHLKLGQLLELNLDFIGSSFSSVLGEIIRVNKTIKNDDHRYELGVEFLGLDRSKRDELMRWLFAKQRELRKKGLI